MGVILHQLGQLDEALASYRSALPVLRRADDQLWLQRIALNRGVLHAQRREFAAAKSDLLEAVRLCRRLDLDLTSEASESGSPASLRASQYSRATK